MTAPLGRVVLRVGGHESPGTPGPGRALALALADYPHAVAVPMTLGRDPGLAPAAAQTIAWAARGGGPGDLLLARPLGTLTHLVGWLRAAVARALLGGGAGRAVLLVAPEGGPDADAELCKAASLVARHLPPGRVEVAFDRGVADGVDRCHRLGAREIVLVPASLAPPPPAPCGGVRVAGPLLAPAAVEALVRRRAGEAEERWLRAADDGLDLAPEHHHHHEHEHETTGPREFAGASLRGAVAHGT
ncbi:hypothetical protein [Actinomadura litoris]|uniref:Cobalamin biosynthesis protein CbiX n=1 Tax=Actinomadura litoris TaxID=2678616 RepID=A0A7K1LEU8_9ACTN|nr:hypothetical protein [Actinomadura litoris]MUN42725.1 hypothetical protein [Actinomadura litoris]